jgi:glutaminyl-peptide cyclotransferase
MKIQRIFSYGLTMTGNLHTFQCFTEEFGILKKVLRSVLLTLFLLGNLCVCREKTPVFDQEQAFAYLKNQCSYGPRNPGSRGHSDCLQYLCSELGKYSKSVRKQTFHKMLPGTVQQITLTNVIASFGTQTDRILLCAHWDTRPEADKDPNPENRHKPIIGANDGASGVAVLLELARVLSHVPAPVGIDLVFFDAEDAGLETEWETWCLGSSEFTEHGLPIGSPRFAVLLDMVGDQHLNFPREYYSNLYARQFVDLIWNRAEKLGIRAFSTSEGPAVIDDHLNLLRAGIPAVDIIDFEYPYWHTLQDTPDKCSSESLGSVGRLLVDLIYYPN